MSILLPPGVPVASLAEAAGLKPVDEGGNVTLLVAKGKAPLMLRRRIEEVWVASDIQLYLDLWTSPARGREQAHHLRRERLGY